MPSPANAPAAGAGQKQRQLPKLFNTLTERQEMPQVKQAIKGFAETQTFTIEKVGVVARIRMLVTAVLTAGEGEIVCKPGFPQKLLKQVSIEANGVTGIISASGITLEQRRRRIYRNPVSAIAAGPVGGTKIKAKEKVEAVFAVEIPVAHDMLSLIGALLAQNEETQLSVEVTWASETEAAVTEAKPFTKGLEGTVTWSSTVFSVGSTVLEGKEEVTVLPDLTAFHGLIDKRTKIVGVGEEEVPLTRNAGQLLAYAASLLNGPDTEEISPAEWTLFNVEYGGNKHPRVWRPASDLLEMNADDFDGPINVNGVHCLVIDNEVDNNVRDMIVPTNLTELRATIGVPAAAKLKEAYALTSQETLYPAV